MSEQEPKQPEQEPQQEAQQAPAQNLSVTNPFQAVSEIFYKPSAVFEALAVKNNWSWIPFLLIVVMAVVPPYLYFGIVDFQWWLELTIAPSLEDLTPAMQEQALENYKAGFMQYVIGASTVIFLLVWFAIVAFYLSLVTKNDDKSVQGFTDWYGVMWWVSLPSILGALVALVLLVMQEPNSQVSADILAPFSLAFLFGTEMSSPWFNFLTSVRIEAIWSIWLTAVCIGTWTHFTKTKALVIAAIPSVVIWLISSGSALGS